MPADDNIDSFFEFFKHQGYERCENADWEMGYEKVAVFLDRDEPTHVARQLDNGRWTSKLGGTEDIEHLHLEDVSSDAYGEPALIMRRLYNA